MGDSSCANSRSRNAMPPPTTRRTAATLATSAKSSSTNNGRVTPSESLLPIPSGAGTKRKERDFDDDTSTMPLTAKHRDSRDETKIDVFVRCRGRNEREVKENSGVVVNTNGVRGETVELSMGPNALGNKTYSFDGVFSPTADQRMIFDEVVRPVLDEVLKGFNCTIFAYGQTGTGKTYTMSGDVSDHIILPDDAGIIPRVLHYLFLHLDSPLNSPASGAASENAVKVSFIELYNEELRDLLSVEDKSNLKIFDGDSRRGAATVVQGMEERYITSAKKGIQLLRNGSHKRQVAATKYNDLSSRSHTIFTVTVNTKRISASGEELLSSGKLNLVDLAGSENIGRSGAENKRAAEAGLINKSLLTLGRVINALVDRSTHTPYRESKLTRLLQDSLGGRTKTCIIATLSPARLSLEETISTLDYAFRAKNIRNKPQINKLISKKTLLKEFTEEIEKLKSELTATRQRNGVYLTNEAYNELTNEAESHRVLVREQREKIDTIECKLARKAQDLLELTGHFDLLKKDSDATKGALENTKSLLEKEKAALAHTKRMLNEEIFVCQQHKRTEQQLTDLNRELATTLGQSTTDIAGLQLKIERLSKLHAENQERYQEAQQDVTDTTTLVDGRLADFRVEQQRLLDALSGHMHAFVKRELDELSIARADLEGKSTAFERSHQDVAEHTTQSKNEINNMLDDVKEHRNQLREKVGAGLNDLSVAATRISEEITTEIDALQLQLHSSYSNLGTDIKMIFDSMSKEISDQRKEMERLRAEMVEANQQLNQSQSRSIGTLSDLIQKESTVRDQENKDLMQGILTLVEANMRQQELRIGAIAQISEQLRSAGQSHSAAGAAFVDGSEQLADQLRSFSDRLVKYGNMMDTRIQSDFMTAKKHTQTLKAVTSSVHGETTRIVEEQDQYLGKEMCALDAIVACIHEQNNTLHASREQSFTALASMAQASFTKLGGTLTASLNRVEGHGHGVAEQTVRLCENLPHLDKDAHIRRQLAELRQRVEQNELGEYNQTGQTPKHREYSYQKAVPRTSSRDTLIARMYAGCVGEDPSSPERPRSPNKTVVFTDNDVVSGQQMETGSAARLDANGLRELDINTWNNTVAGRKITNTEKTTLLEKGGGNNALMALPSLKRSASSSTSGESKVPSKKRGLRSMLMIDNSAATSNVALADRENLTTPK